MNGRLARLLHDVAPLSQLRGRRLRAYLASLSGGERRAARRMVAWLRQHPQAPRTAVRRLLLPRLALALACGLLAYIAVLVWR